MRGFSVAHQKVSVHVDLKAKTLRGWTELTIVPTRLDLRTVVLDARRMQIEKCVIDSEEVLFEHHDVLNDEYTFPKSWDVHYHQMYAKKLGSLLTDTHGDCPGELVVNFPENLQVREPSESTFVASHSSREKTYEPITLRVYYRVNEYKNEGLNFVGGKEPHVFTTHNPIGQATSCWLPCVDGLWSLSTWELEVHVDQFLDPEDLDSEIIVVGNNVAPAERPDPQMPQGKIVRFVFFSPISSQHLGFAAGPFKPVQLVASEDKPDDKDVSAANATGSATASAGTAANTSSSGSGSTILPITAYALPSRAHLVANTCSPIIQAMDYFTHDFGSFPFASYSLCFVHDFPRDASPTADACALTICDDNLLFSEDLIEPRFEDCHLFVRNIAAQWCGVSIVPASVNDLWVTEGIAAHLADLFIRKLMGNNEYRMRIRWANDRLCREDVDRAPIGKPQFRLPLSSADLWFIRLKAPLVLFILDRRMTKTDRSLGISRVLTKLFLQSMSGDLRSQLSTTHFVRQCEKVAHHRLTKFFDEWVYGSGFPVFRITQRFNKKRLCIEMGIGQVHSHELPKESLSDDTLLQRAVTHIDMTAPLDRETLQLLDEMPKLDVTGEATGEATGDDAATGDGSKKLDFVAPPHFTGPMTIRIHEANGTPYEHVVELRDQLTKIDIPYNTKYKRLRRNQKFRRDVSGNTAVSTPDTSAGAGASADSGPSASNEDGGAGQVINCLGDVLMTDAEINDWHLVDWADNDGDDEVMFNEAFEWLRADADFEWLGRFFVSQPDYMYASQLQQDQDVVAQYEAVRFFGRQQPHPLYYTVLVRTLMDQRYFYGVRVEAAHQLVKMAVPQLQYAGMYLLLNAFRVLYCFRESRLPRANNFTDIPSYFVQKAIPLALSRIKEPHTGRCPPEVCQFLMDLLRYNENSENPFSDCFYVADLLRAVTATQLGSSPVALWDDAESAKFIEDVVGEINKSQRLDRWVPSYRHVITTTCIKMEEQLVESRFGEPRMDKLLLSTQPDESADIRLASLSSLLNLGGYQNEFILQYVKELLFSDELLSVRSGVLVTLKRLVGHIAIHGEYRPTSTEKTSDPISRRQQALARRSAQTVIPVLRSTIGQCKPLQEMLWSAVQDPRAGSLERRMLLEICSVLFEPTSRMMAVMKAPPLFELSMRRRRDFTMTVKYRSILRKKKEVPKLKLKLK